MKYCFSETIKKSLKSRSLLFQALLIVLIIAIPCSLLAQKTKPAKVVEKTGKTSSIASMSESVEVAQSELQVNEEMIAGKLAELSENTKLPEPQKNRVEEAWGKAKASLIILNEWEKKLNDLKRVAENAPQTIEEFQKKLEKNDRLYIGAEFSKLSIADLENHYVTEDALLKSNKAKILELEISIDAINKRRQEIPDLVFAARSKQEEIAQEKPSASVEDVIEIAQAKSALRAIQQRIFKTEATAYDYELSTFEVRLSLVKAQREFILRISHDMEEYLEKLQSFVSEKKKVEAEKATQKAQQRVENLADSLPELKKLAEENASFTALRGEVLDSIDRAGKDLESGKKLLDKLVSDQRALKEKIRAMGFSDSMGLLFRMKRGELPNPSIYRERIARRQSLISKIQGKLLNFEDKANKMLDLKRFQNDTIDAIKLANKASVEAIDASVREITKSRRDSIDNLVKEYRILFGRLIDLDAMEGRLLDIIRQFESFINENVFWITSADPIRLDDFSSAYSGVKEIFAFQFWYKVGSDLIKALFANVWFSMLAILILLLILSLRSSVIIMNLKLSEIVNKALSDNVFLTVKAFFLTILMTSFIPVCIWFLSSLLRDESIVSINGKQVGDALITLLPISWLILFLRGCFREKGLVNVHFRWHLESVAEVLRRQFLLLFVFSVPIYFFCFLAFASDNTYTSVGLGRLLFIALVLTTSFILHPITFPGGAIFNQVQENFKDKLIFKLRYLFYFISVIFPFSMGLFASIGYLFTAEQLYMRSVTSMVISVAAIFSYGFIFRILQVQRRSLAMIKRQEKLASDESKAEAEGQESLISLANEGPSIYSISKQANNIIASILLIAISIYLWNVWKDVLPAVKIFDQVALWTTEMRVDEVITAPDGSVTKQVVEKVVDISLIDVLLALTVLVLTFLGNRNIQGFLEFALLQRLALDNGIRFAVTTLTKYLITILGTVWAFKLIGIGWEKVQWLVTGVSVGLGFGLQEIFANFVSGLIILFERPLRVGDYIVVGEHSGYVSEIKIRATTILTMDRRELVIPNKEFITGKIINWTLSERMFRLDFPVGVAYTSDLEKVQKVLLEVASNNPRVQSNPAPKAVLMGFGDSSLNFELRVCIPSPENFPDFQNEINLAITTAFRENGISIPFPQRDLHMIAAKESEK